MPIWHIPNCDGEMCKWWTWSWEQKEFNWIKWDKINDVDGDDIEVNDKEGD